MREIVQYVMTICANNVNTIQLLKERMGRMCENKINLLIVLELLTEYRDPLDPCWGIEKRRERNLTSQFQYYL